ncbi:hypothetical protein N5V81_13520 [Escherichia coli]|nr:hypothetical protein [Escherichia coli]
MATVVKKKRLHELDSYDGDKSSAVALISVDEKEYKLPLSEIGGGADANPIQNLSGADGVVEIDPNIADDFIIRLGDRPLRFLSHLLPTRFRVRDMNYY